MKDTQTNKLEEETNSQNNFNVDKELENSYQEQADAQYDFDAEAEYKKQLEREIETHINNEYREPTEEELENAHLFESWEAMMNFQSKNNLTEALNEKGGSNKE